MARATAHIGTDQYATTLHVAGRTIIADEPEDNGGKDAGLICATRRGGPATDNPTCARLP